MELERREHDTFTMKSLGKTSYVNFSSLLTTSKFVRNLVKVFLLHTRVVRALSYMMLEVISRLYDNLWRNPLAVDWFQRLPLSFSNHFKKSKLNSHSARLVPL